MSLPDFLARLQGKRPAYDTTEEVAELLDEQYGRIQDTRLPLHLRRTAHIEELLGFQPGLVDARAKTADLALYTEALITAASAGGHTDLAERLVEVAEALHTAVAELAAATHATAPADRLHLAHAA
ncbi:hypothetical protein OG756_42185 (plasmid) [Streptomyces sp. NBC_01310]|uniref:hypothetical protein n=1 Tax=Streptomyces sp. NBC_01310 TaxID=2903820 RepID=UPI0035B607F0|nr:hypothetical protein OG756_42185 [Streptomyces sp. NBC_01310]